MNLQARYQAEGLPRGITVAEWEVYEGLPMFSVYPEAKNASSIHARGYFMYRDASPEERAALNSRGGASRKNTVKPLASPAELAAKRLRRSEQRHRKYLERKQAAA